MFLTNGINYCYENFTPLQVAIAMSLLLLCLLYLYLRDMDVPPGPRGIPLFGYWPFINAETCHVQLQELSKQYGDVFSLRITGKLLIHLGSLKAIKEAHLTKTEYFGGRCSSDSIFSFMFNEGVAFANGEPWRILRKFFQSKFKEYGMNAVKENAACSVYDTLNDTVEELRNSKGRPIDITDIITMKCMRNLRRIIFNDEGMTKEELTELISLYSKMMKGMTNTNLLLTGTFAKYFIFPLMPCSWMLKRCNKRIEDILFAVVNRHKSEYNEDHVVDLVDCFLKERDERRRRGDPTAAYFSDKALVSSLHQFVTDGVLSVSVFIGSFLMMLVEYPDEQEKIYKEIIEVIGPERLPTLEDKNKLPFTNAFMYEVMRFTDFFPLFPSLECTKETTLHGYKIPVGSLTLLNLYAANRNPNDFENPEEFIPSRYLSSENKPRADLPIIFGIGKRACIGEGFSMIQTFLLLTIIVQNFRLSSPKDAQGSFAFSATERLKMCVHPRSHTSH